MARLPKLTSVVLAFACVACRSGSKQAPPPEEGTELASAAPRAIGAFAGGTDAAPPAVFVPRSQVQEPEGLPVPEIDPDAGAELPDAAVEGDELPL